MVSASSQYSQNLSQDPAYWVKNGLLVLTEDNNNRIDKARLALHAVQSLVESANDISVKVSRMEHGDQLLCVEPASLGALLSLIGEQLVMSCPSMTAWLRDTQGSAKAMEVEHA